MENTKTKIATDQERLKELEKIKELAAALSEKNKGDLHSVLDDLLLEACLSYDTPTSQDTFTERLEALSDEIRAALLIQLYAIVICQVLEKAPLEVPEGKRNIVVMAWHSISCINLDMFSTAHTALSQLDLHGDPEGAKAVIACVQSYIMDIQEYLDDHLEDLKCAFNQLYPLADLWPDKEKEVFPRGVRQRG